jgi:DNA helicase HerA-like ATPase
MAAKFKDAMAAGYALKEPAVVLGSPLDGDKVLPDVRIQAALSMLNRHGLIAGATGTGKTKTLQGIAEQLSEAGVPCFVADIKGDVSGMAVAGDAANPKVAERVAELHLTGYKPTGHPVEFLSLSGKLGAQVRASVHSFGPLLLGRVLGLNDTQTSILSLVFKYCDDNELALLDLKDLTTTLKYLGSDEAKPVLADYGGISPASLGVIMRSIVTLQQQGADVFFGEPEFEVEDLLRTDGGKGVVSILELSDVMDKPAMFSTFMLWMLAQLYHTLPEVGDLPRPKLVFFFDEAHLLFEDASKTLLDQIEQTARLIRSKGVGVFFVTQVPMDVPSSVLAQLGNRVQHALRVFTPEDADNLRKTVRTFPMTSFFDVGERLTSLGIGEALVTVLSPKGVPTPLAPTRIVPPDSSMAALPPDQLQARIRAGTLYAKYAQSVDPQSAHEIITARIAGARVAAQVAAAAPAGAGYAAPPNVVFGGPTAAQARAAQKELERRNREIERQARAQAKRDETAHRAAQREAARTARQREREIAQLGNTVIRGVFGTLMGGSRRRR